ncbi:histidinol dehydrogenase [Rhodovulum sp. 12E13]|uniref:histidinol dehydrogenase n=1 Tax=Rhodovulum sp. 12E13 TaxID=2203891 RepID=UPI000E1AD066|nr:histidinol dehydrogenase [Rhodovulum sp. 12E13]RDC71036.1 histidinol dehydrogenase [Rhodovulum sp. 12E13]
MCAIWLKKARPPSREAEQDLREGVSLMLSILEAEREDAALRYARQFDRWEGDIVVPAEALAEAGARVSDALKRDIVFAHDNIRRFAEAQLATIGETEVEIVPGLIAGQRQIPVGTAGAYVPGGRYAHVASAVMTITTAKVAGVSHVTACSPPSTPQGIPPEILYAMHVCGADTVLNLGGVQAIAAMAFGLFDTPPADILVGPGNAYVAEAKRALYGRCGIDMVAGPTDALVVADRGADPEIVAADLVGQAEHGFNSPVWLVTDHRPLADTVLRLVPAMIDALPEPNRASAEAAWRDHGEVVLCTDREDMARVSDGYAPEHLQVQAADLDWWLRRLSVYGSLFLGEETTVAMGDKASGPNHVLPTSGAARYTGGLSVHKFLKTVTWQRATREGMRPVAEATARISRLEGMEGHARSAEIRLRKFFDEA